jgi:Alpha/beta hydrolase family
VIPGSYVLVHSPLTGTVAWGRLPELLRGEGYDVVVLDVQDDDESPFADRYVAQAVAQIRDTRPATRSLLVAHSGAGALLPPIAAALRAIDRRVSGYVFLDAVLPLPERPSRLDLLHQEGAAFAAAFADALRAGARFPTWTVDDLADIVPNLDDRVALVESLRPRGHGFFTEPLPEIDGWPDAPCGYLRTSTAYDHWMGVAEHRGWPMVQRDLGHFPALADPEGTLNALLELTARL